VLKDQATHAGKDQGKFEGGSPPLAPIKTTWRWLNRWHSGIGLRLVASVLLFSSAITLLLTLLQLYFDYRRDVGTIDRQISEIEGSYRRSLGEGLWNLDAPQLELQVDGILRLPGIRFVEVREATDRANAMLVTAGSRQANADVHREFPIFHMNRGAEQTVGVLSIEATFDDVYRRLFDTAIVILISQGAKTFVVSFFILYIVNRLITRHLVTAAEFFGGYDLRRLPPPLRLKRRPLKQVDELDQLVGAFNGMCASLQTAYGELRDSEQRFRELQMEVAHANRVATVGQLSASIAHEVRQPITAAITNVYVARRWLRRHPPNVKEALEALDKSAKNNERAGEIIAGITALFRKAPQQKAPLDINEAIREVIGLAEAEMQKSGISVAIALDEGLPRPEGDRVQLQQVMLNLINNAVQAMSATEVESRELVISTSETHCDGIVVTVRDSGPGLDPSDPERVFEAFYTTKPGGVGMGLLICRSIIEAHGGRLWASANIPRGATFQFTIPVRGQGAPESAGVCEPGGRQPKANEDKSV
jgi:signal transduction histidine kinase